MQLSASAHNATFPAFDHVSRTDQYYAGLSFIVLGGLVAVSPLHHGGTTHYAAVVHRTLIIVLVGLFLWHAMTARVLEIRREAYAWPVMGFLLWALLSLAWSPYRHQSFQWVMVLIGYALLLGVTPPLFSRARSLTGVLAVIMVAGLGQALWGAIQLLDGVTRPKGSFFNPNFFAGYLAAISVFPLAMLCGRERSTRSAGSGRAGLLPPIGAALAVAVMGMMIVVTGSRGAAVAWTAGVAVVLFARFGMRALAGLVGLAIIVSLVPNPLQHRALLEHEVNPLSYARLDMWQSTLKMIVDHPAGIGLGLYQYVFPQYAFPLEHQFVRYGTMAQYAHSDLLQIAAELGLIGAAFFAWGLWTVAREIRGHWENPARTSPTWILSGVTACITVILVQAAVDSNLHEPPIAILLTICVGIVGATCRSAGGSRPPLVRCRIDRPAHWAVASALVTMLLTLGVARTGVAWAYYERGTQALQARDLQMALGAFGMAAWLDSGKALYQSARAATYFQLFEQHHDVRNAAETVGVLSEARRLNPLDGRLAALQGQVFVTLVLSLDRTMPDVDVQRRRLLEQAREAYGVAVEREPFSALYAFELARVEQALGHERRAQEIVIRTLDLEPNFLPAREWLVRLHVRHGELESANQEYEQIVARHRAVAGGRVDSLEGRYVQVDVPALASLLARKQES